MTLTPNARSTLIDALQAPSGYHLDAAVATTYSLDLVALLLANLSFGAVESMDEDAIRRVDPIRRLEAARRYGEATTVFTQAGAIHVPNNYYDPFAFVEDSIIEVSPPETIRLFHPKLWVLRFAPDKHFDDDGGSYLHRVMVLSRNLTMDNSWDTILVLDEDPDGTIDAEPAAEFIQALPQLALRPVTPEHAERVASVAQSLRRVRLAAPHPYTGGYLQGIGLDGKKVWPFPRTARRVLAISPFLTDNAVRTLNRVQEGNYKNARILVSRAESLDSLNPKSYDRFWLKTMLDDPADEHPLDDGPDLSEATELALKEHRGLHAKTYILDLHPRRGQSATSHTITGSANLTYAPWRGSVEFIAVLEGATSETGTARTYFGSHHREEGKNKVSEGAEGLSALLVDHHVAQQKPLPASVNLTRQLEQYHRDLAQCLPQLRVTLDAAEQDQSETSSRARLDWSFKKPLPQAPKGSKTTMWLASAEHATAVEGTPTTGTWTVARQNVTPFIAVETKVSAGRADEREEVTRRCLLKADLTGDTDWRQKDQIFDVLSSREDILRYLMFLLGDPLAEANALTGATRGMAGATTQGSAGLAPIIFERLVRATGRDSDALGRIAELLKDLEDHPNRDQIDLDDLHMLWDSVWAVHKEVTANE